MFTFAILYIVRYFITNYIYAFILRYYIATIGICYSEYARQELDSYDNISLGLKQVSRSMATRMNIAQSGM